MNGLNPLIAMRTNQHQPAGHVTVRMGAAENPHWWKYPEGWRYPEITVTPEDIPAELDFRALTGLSVVLAADYSVRMNAVAEKIKAVSPVVLAVIFTDATLEDGIGYIWERGKTKLL